ncbi:hypothetical protein M087_4224 [Bacteroides fragilis str. S23 R14]|uniref:hypothetical protein n=1 Tax=Bacteroides fragilis TaxID=817 RepID=UPI0004475307|nr:hypothetical protein [Bacteroides fragilis]EXZ98259.1 hypothetical protein M087_4224 [Bacteroides fragilis str. S23 R14]EYA64234.1 hypothetical protein M139_4500 [Bacteroides fragilis str. S23L24]EYE41571.1 hypothetical protein M138_4459 [Bacteroides fragilis str. S23L17]
MDEKTLLAGARKDMLENARVVMKLEGAPAGIAILYDSLPGAPDWYDIRNVAELIAFLSDYRETIPVLFEIRKLVTIHGYDVQVACKHVFRYWGRIPKGFIRQANLRRDSAIMGYTTYHLGYRRGRCFSVGEALDLLPILPKAWLKDVEV